VTATDTYKANVLIENEVISQIGENLSAIGAEVIDAKECYVFPGGG
jgi:dihydropyrimidinase